LSPDANTCTGQEKRISIGFWPPVCIAYPSGRDECLLHRPACRDMPRSAIRLRGEPARPRPHWTVPCPQILAERKFRRDRCPYLLSNKANIQHVSLSSSRTFQKACAVPGNKPAKLLVTGAARKWLFLEKCPSSAAPLRFSKALRCCLGSGASARPLRGRQAPVEYEGTVILWTHMSQIQVTPHTTPCRPSAPPARLALWRSIRIMKLIGSAPKHTCGDSVCEPSAAATRASRSVPSAAAAPAGPASAAASANAENGSRKQSLQPHGQPDCRVASRRRTPVRQRTHSHSLGHYC